MHSMAPDRILKWGERAHVRRETPDKFFVVPSTVLALRVQLVVWWTLLRCSAQFCPSLVCWSSTHGAPCPAICKYGGGAGAPLLYEVGTTACTISATPSAHVAEESQLYWTTDRKYIVTITTKANICGNVTATTHHNTKYYIFLIAVC